MGKININLKEILIFVCILIFMYIIYKSVIYYKYRSIRNNEVVDDDDDEVHDESMGPTMCDPDPTKNQLCPGGIPCPQCNKPACPCPPPGQGPPPGPPGPTPTPTGVPCSPPGKCPGGGDCPTSLKCPTRYDKYYCNKHAGLCTAIENTKTSAPGGWTIYNSQDECLQACTTPKPGPPPPKPGPPPTPPPTPKPQPNWTGGPLINGSSYKVYVGSSNKETRCQNESEDTMTYYNSDNEKNPPGGPNLCGSIPSKGCASRFTNVVDNGELHQCVNKNDKVCQANNNPLANIVSCNNFKPPPPLTPPPPPTGQLMHITMTKGNIKYYLSFGRTGYYDNFKNPQILPGPYALWSLQPEISVYWRDGYLIWYGGEVAEASEERYLSSSYGFGKKLSEGRSYAYWPENKHKNTELKLIQKSNGLYLQNLHNDMYLSETTGFVKLPENRKYFAVWSKDLDTPIKIEPYEQPDEMFSGDNCAADKPDGKQQYCHGHGKKFKCPDCSGYGGDIDACPCPNCPPGEYLNTHGHCISYCTCTNGVPDLWCNPKAYPYQKCQRCHPGFRLDPPSGQCIKV